MSLDALYVRLLASSVSLELARAMVGHDAAQQRRHFARSLCKHTGAAGEEGIAFLLHAAMLEIE